MTIYKQIPWFNKGLTPSRCCISFPLEYLEGWKLGEEGQACFFKDDNGSIIVAFEGSGLPPSS